MKVISEIDVLEGTDQAGDVTPIGFLLKGGWLYLITTSLCMSPVSVMYLFDYVNKKNEEYKEIFFPSWLNTAYEI